MPKSQLSVDKQGPRAGKTEDKRDTKKQKSIKGTYKPLGKDLGSK